ncbi:MAG: hypothetical protein AAGN82_25590 [Myxococcota bacterium]
MPVPPTPVVTTPTTDVGETAVVNLDLAMSLDAPSSVPIAQPEAFVPALAAPLPAAEAHFEYGVIQRPGGLGYFRARFGPSYRRFWRGSVRNGVDSLSIFCRPLALLGMAMAGLGLGCDVPQTLSPMPKLRLYRVLFSIRNPKPPRSTEDELESLVRAVRRKAVLYRNAWSTGGGGARVNWFLRRTAKETSLTVACEKTCGPFDTDPEIHDRWLGIVDYV